MSNNLLGKDENLNAVQPDFVTGGESLSELLKNPHCPLRTLNVSRVVVYIWDLRCTSCFMLLLYVLHFQL